MRFKTYLIERNIANIDIIKDLIESIVKEKDITEPKFKKWFRSNLLNYIINHYPGEKIKEWPRNLSNKPDWFQKAINRGDDVYKILLDHGFLENIRHIADYFNANPNLRVDRMSYDEANKNADKWTKSLIKNAVDEEDWDGIKPIMKIDSYKWVKVFSKHALDREGKLMNHCVGSYYDLVKNNVTTIYSLRDLNNKPHVTIEVTDKIKQIQGNSNSEPKEEYKKYIIKFLKEKLFKNNINMVFKTYDNNYIGGGNIISIIDIKNLYNKNEFKEIVLKSQYARENILKAIKIYPETLFTPSEFKNIIKTSKGMKNIDLIQLGLIRIEKKIFEIDINNNDFIIIKTNLKMPDNVKIDKLPKKLRILKNLYMNAANINIMPEELEVDGDCWFDGLKTYKLPKYIKCTGYFCVPGCTAKIFPNILIVKGDVSFKNTTITELPKKFKCGGDLILMGSKITKLPDNLVINGDLYLNWCKKIQKLPKKLKVGKTLNIVSSKIKEIPNDLEAGNIVISREMESTLKVPKHLKRKIIIGY